MFLLSIFTSNTIMFCLPRTFNTCTSFAFIGHDGLMFIKYLKTKHKEETHHRLKNTRKVKVKYQSMAVNWLRAEMTHYLWSVELTHLYSR